ncbi:hypothetical protein H9Y05_02035 [Crocinitomicaceae bacterium CZZ-1]|uniref:Uncharacterized protein n=1 Tax=Taishania pollutisoli TaxID=2766479 RepID=A0A8J6TSG4_9FLAO|nr:hypothetical protein [Taishania pollutisoli]MBC9811244.1 hypothetical protein [Taishania pollutisoli]MBX2947841.1 hypothetical protein [Crocinitomicaceae bacterium]NGF75027.1 hypothetical protein [Fluviicola sp. SGL-29]
MLHLLFAFATFLTLGVYGQQQYSYSFSGTIENSVDLETKIQQIEGINSCKIKYKEELSAGEILLDIKPYTKQKEGENPDLLIQLKKLITDSGLIPVELIEIKH